MLLPISISVFLQQEVHGNGVCDEAVQTYQPSFRAAQFLFTFKLHNIFYLCDMHVATTKNHDRGYYYHSFSPKYLQI